MIRYITKQIASYSICGFCFNFAVEVITFVRELQDLKVTDLGSMIELECEISKEGLKLDWYKEKTKIRRDEKFNYLVTDGTVHKLLIEKPSAEDAGEYRAVYEKLETKAKVTIAGMF